MIFRVFFIEYCLRYGGCNLGSIYIINFILKTIHTTATLHWNSDKILVLRPSVVKPNYFFGKLDPNYCLFKFYYKRTLEIIYKTLQLAVYILGMWDFQLAH